MYNHILYLAYWAVSAVTLYGFGMLGQDGVVLGVNKFAPIEAAIYGAFWLTFFVWCMWDMILARGVKLEPVGLAWGYFLVVNILGVWLVSYAAKYTGVQVDGYWVLLVAGVGNLVQRGVWDWIVGRRS